MTENSNSGRTMSERYVPGRQAVSLRLRCLATGVELEIGRAYIEEALIIDRVKLDGNIYPRFTRIRLYAYEDMGDALWDFATGRETLPVLPLKLLDDWETGQFSERQEK